MNSSDLFKKEAFEQVVVTLVPGLIAVLPYSFVLWAYFPCLASVWEKSSVALSLLGLVVAVTTGLILETFGGWIESHVWDRIIQRFVDPDHLVRWEKYLQLTMDPEPVGQRYLRTKVMVMKFELGVALAMVVGWIGLAWLQALKPVISGRSFCLMSLVMLAIVTYLLWDSYESAKILAKVRRLIIEALEGE